MRFVSELNRYGRIAILRFASELFPYFGRALGPKKQRRDYSESRLSSKATCTRNWSWNCIEVCKKPGIVPRKLPQEYAGYWDGEGMRRLTMMHDGANTANSDLIA